MNFELFEAQAGFVLEKYNEDGKNEIKDASRGNYEEHLIRDNTRYAFYFENI